MFLSSLQMSVAKYTAEESGLWILNEPRIKEVLDTALTTMDGKIADAKQYGAFEAARASGCVHIAMKEALKNAGGTSAITGALISRIGALELQLRACKEHLK